MTIGERIRRLRQEKGLTQEAVAAALGISRQAIAKWESGQSTPSTDNLLKLAELFRVSLADLADAGQPPEVPRPDPGPERRPAGQGEGKAAGAVWRKAGEVAVIVLAYAAVYAGSLAAFHLAGVESCIWSWMQAGHVLWITCLFTAAAVLLGRRAAGASLFLGTIAAVFLANAAGTLAMQRSPIRYNNGWVFYLAVLYSFFAAGCLIDLKRAGRNTGSGQRGRGAAAAVFAAAAAALFLGSVFLAVRHVRYGVGAEQGYTAGFSAGAADGEEGAPRDSAVPVEDAAARYGFGSAAFKGYAVHWSEGYTDGYAEAAGG